MVNISDFEALIRSFMVQQMAEKYPDIDTTEDSVFDDLYIKTNTASMVPFIDAVNTNDSVLDLVNIDQISDEMLESIGENNFGIIRNAGKKATTILSISYTRISDTDPVIIPAGSTFYTKDNTLGYQVLNTVTFTPAEMLGKYDVNTVLYTINVPVTAIGAGSEYNVVSNQITVFPTNFPIYTDSVTNKEAVINGVDKESKSDYLMRFKEFYSTRNIGTKNGYRSDIIQELPNISDSLIIGKDDPEMIRDVFNVLIGGSPKVRHMGGKVDIYIKGSSYDQVYTSLTCYSGKLKLAATGSLITAASISVTNTTDVAKTPVFTVEMQKTDDVDICRVIINNTGGQSFDPTKTSTIRVAYDVVGVGGKVEEFICGLMTTELAVPFKDIISVSCGGTNFTPADYTLKRTDLFGEIITSASPEYLSNQEKVTITISQLIGSVNGEAVTVLYSVNSSVGLIHNHYNQVEERIITSDILIKESLQVPVNVGVEVKLRDMEVLDLTRRVQLESIVSEYVASLKIGSPIKESDIIGAIYADSTAMGYVKYIKLPLLSFYKPVDPSAAIENIRVDQSFIQPSTTEYIILNKIRITEILD